MPTNVTTPLWRCDACGTTHGERLDLAELCESAPVPDELPEGTPLLASVNSKLALMPLRATGRIETDVTPYQLVAGHHRQYEASHPASPSSAWAVTDKKLAPAEPGHVQIVTGRYSSNDGRLHFSAEAAPKSLDVDELVKALGLGHPDSHLRAPRTPQRHRVSFEHWNIASTVAPITPEIRAVFDALGVHLSSGYRTNYQIDNSRDQHIFHEHRGNIYRSRAVATRGARDEVGARILDLQRRWFAGEPISAPWPRLEASSTATYSKLTKSLRALVDATGVPWERRTSATDYARHLIQRSLVDTTVRANLRLFGPARTIAVGGQKGGIGKSTVAAALALRLSRQGVPVTLIDCDLDDPSQHNLFGLPSKVEATADLTGITPHAVSDTLSVFSHGQIEAAAPSALPLRWTEADGREWLRFLTETLDIPAGRTVILDLPAGNGPIGRQVLSSGQASVDGLVAVASPDPLSVQGLRDSLALQMHERRTRIVVENLGRITGLTADGQTVEIRPHGDNDILRQITEDARATWAGSLPYAGTLEQLAASDELGVLADAVAEVEVGGDSAG